MTLVHLFIFVIFVIHYAVTIAGMDDCRDDTTIHGAKTKKENYEQFLNLYLFVNMCMLTKSFDLFNI